MEAVQSGKNRNWRVFTSICTSPSEYNPSYGVPEASWNMALDEVLYRNLIDIEAAPPPFLRFYCWDRPAITIGVSQNVDRTIALKNCQQNGIKIVRRITGGRGILHGDDLTFSLGASLADLGLPAESGILDIYATISELLIGGFESIGIAAEVGGCPALKAADTRGDCFASASRADVVESATGRKLLGAALHKRAGFILMQGSIPLYSRTTEYSALAEKCFIGKGAALPNAAERGIVAEDFRAGTILKLRAGRGVDPVEWAIEETDRVRTLHLASDSYGTL